MGFRRFPIILNTQGGKPTNGTLIFKLFSKRDQLKIKLANLKFSKIGDGH